MAIPSTSHAPNDMPIVPATPTRRSRGLLRSAAIAVAIGLLALVPLSISAPPAGAAPGDDSDGDLIVDIVDPDDDNDGMDDQSECDGTAAGSRFVGDLMADRLGLELRPSDLGMALSDSDVTASLDISERFGYPPGTGAVVVSVEHANRHPGADVFIGGVNPVADGTPTRISFSGTLGVYLDIRHDVQWFDNDVKTLETHDGTRLTDWFQMANPAYAIAGFSKSEAAGADGQVYTITGPPTVSPYPTIYYNGYSSELAGTIPNLRFVQPTTEFSFDSALVHAGLYPVINIFMYAECDTDDDGIADRLDTDSDNDTCPDLLEGMGASRTAGSAAVTTSPASTDVVVGSAAQFDVTAEAQATSTFADGSPDWTVGVPETPTYQWFVSTDGGATFAPVAGSTSSSLVVDPVTSAMSGRHYRVRVASASNPCGLDSASAVLTVFHPPVAADDTEPTPIAPGGAGEISILTNDVDPDGPPTPAGVHEVDLDPSTPTIDTVRITPEGRWTYDPVTAVVRFEAAAAGPTGTASIGYRLCDTTGLCSDATVSFVVAPRSSPIAAAATTTTSTTPAAPLTTATIPGAPTTPTTTSMTPKPTTSAGVRRPSGGTLRSGGLAFTGGTPGVLVAIAGIALVAGLVLMGSRRRT